MFGVAGLRFRVSGFELGVNLRTLLDLDELSLPQSPAHRANLIRCCIQMECDLANENYYTQVLLLLL